MADDAQDRNLPASERKIQKARADGQVARSRDLGHLAAVGAGVALLIAFAPTFTAWLSLLLTDGLRFDATALARPGAMTERLSHSTFQMLLAVVPLGAVVALVAVAASVLSGGWNFTLKPLEPKFEKFDPISGIGRLFSKQQLVETLKVCLLALVLGAIGAMYLKAQLPAFAGLIALPLPAALAEAGALLQGGLLLLLLALGTFALVDVPLQRQMLLRRLRMSVQEAKKEHKDVEGNTEVKGKIKAKMRELANRRMIAAVPGADLVVMNPTHFAVALKYDEATMGAPRVVAKGADLLAFKIRDAAQGAKVPVLQAPPLARALYKHAEIDQEIPAALFSAVAQVLAWVFQLRAAMAAGRPMTTPQPQVQVPDGMDPLHPVPATAATPPKTEPEP
ncbi:EscU/YscU/HrcU family type III secretion system export apparatus switch protein [Rubrivivax sp. RP6-9]|uniref:EscU/YscU/HrcU family type III secretion system export apparatus switch protein n=1 Tax=Rubrivivax sp. RP6-9 TaxID=3415750 RepID=UPI003CC6C13A